MPHYDFKNLSPLDYEDLSRDLLQQESGLTFESFKPGKDGGIDLRHLKTKNHSIIVQCKRYYDYRALISTLKKELKKVIKINPSRYIIRTSIELSPSNKDEICNLFNPYILNTNDIYGQNDFNNLLGKFPEIEKKHYKLWLSSTNILENIIYSRIHNQSIFENEIIQETVKTYAPNDSLENAVKIINKNKYVVISGIPGIGKSTLAKMLCYHYIKNHDFEDFVYITDSIGEAISTYKESKRQIFLFDDFLGSNFLE
ncbi:hypothetical protein EI293_19610 [Hymenobacter perfusus]|uniref:Uncharacterized protein n=1 Tax=Hymenobacter perfusus TaxID=1236770 RepID=A0A428K1B2_9BACT|nr:restriction endonuclease [Hymenobacter perfusus]RSK40178.1 hypothetical protein EI293_19610 [Hymenobacter perfusus]